MVPESTPSARLHPCVACGACCATFRVSFYWREAEPGDSDHPVPKELTDDLTPMRRCMKGTNVKRSRKCIALDGRIGEKAICTIYANRPTPCRDFEASYANGKHMPRCDQAREGHGLPPLRREDWIGLG